VEAHNAEENFKFRAPTAGYAKLSLRLRALCERSIEGNVLQSFVY